MQIDFLKKELSYKRKIILLPHKNPDGDALGSCLGLFLYLKNEGHEVCVISPTSYSHLLAWLPSSEEIIVFSSENKQKIEEKISSSELIFFIDFNDLSRIAPLDKLILEKASPNSLKILIDHHQNPSSFDFMFWDASASSTTLLVYKWMEALGELDKITPEIANCLYSGLVSDTGSFSYSLSSETHLIASKLIEKGAQIQKINTHLYGSYPISRFSLLSCVLGNMKFLSEFSTSFMTLSVAQMKAHGYKKGDSEGFVNYGLSIKDALFSVFFVEDLDLGITKISFRSRGNFDVNEFARKHFDGGGHKNAAGGSSKENLDETIKKFLEILASYKDKLSLAKIF